MNDTSLMLIWLPDHNYHIVRFFLFLLRRLSFSILTRVNVWFSSLLEIIKKRYRSTVNFLMADQTGIEPAIFSVTGRHVNRYTTDPRWRSKRDLNSRTRLPQSKSLAGTPLRPLEYCSVAFKNIPCLW